MFIFDPRDFPMRRAVRGVTLDLIGAACVLALVMAGMMRPQVALAQSDPAASTTSGEVVTYTVQPGDWLSRIAARYETTVSAILALNPQISNADRIVVGQEILIPVSDEPGTPPGDNSGNEDDAAVNVTIAPTTGAPGTVVQVRAFGLPANTLIEIGTGPVASEYDIIATAESNAQGALNRAVAMPERINVGEQWVVALTPVGSPADYISNRFTVTEPSDEDGSPDLFTRTNIYLVALEDGGRTGMQTGCGDSVVPVEVEIEPTLAVLTAAMRQLVNLDERFYGQSGLYNALYRSDLRVDDVTIRNGTATVQLSGQVSLGGVCDAPRFRAQLRQSALQFYTVDAVEIFINGETLDSVIQ